MASQASNVSVGPTPAQVYIPASVGVPNVTLFNNSASPVYIGGSSVTIATGLLLNPNQGFDLPFAATGIWAVSGPGTLGTATTLSAASVQYAGTINAASTSGYTAGQTVQIGAGSAAEIATIGTIPSGTTLVFSSGLKFAHGSGEALALVAGGAGGSLNILTGTR